MENSIYLERINNSIILTMLVANISNIEFDLHIKYLKQQKNINKIYIDIGNLTDIDNNMLLKFYKLHHALPTKEISIINVNAINNCILNMFKIDKIFQIYLNSQNAFEKKYPIINRQFKLVS